MKHFLVATQHQLKVPYTVTERHKNVQDLENRDELLANRQVFFA